MDGFRLAVVMITLMGWKPMVLAAPFLPAVDQMPFDTAEEEALAPLLDIRSSVMEFESLTGAREVPRNAPGSDTSSGPDSAVNDTALDDTDGSQVASDIESNDGPESTADEATTESVYTDASEKLKILESSAGTGNEATSSEVQNSHTHVSGETTNISSDETHDSSGEITETDASGEIGGTDASGEIAEPDATEKNGENGEIYTDDNFAAAGINVGTVEFDTSGKNVETETTEDTSGEIGEVADNMTQQDQTDSTNLVTESSGEEDLLVLDEPSSGEIMRELLSARGSTNENTASVTVDASGDTWGDVDI